MDEYLTEKEQIERIKEWWRENRWYLIGGFVIAASGYIGFDQYRAYEARVAEAAAAIYQELVLAVEDDDRARADELLGQLAAEYSSSAYLDQARFLLASENLVRDTPRAISELEAVVAGSNDDGLEMIARSRLARALAYDEQYERALEVLSVADPGDFGPRFSEIRGDIEAASGNATAAISAYTEALVGAAAIGIDTSLLQLKLNDLVQSQPETIELIDPETVVEDAGDEG